MFTSVWMRSQKPRWRVEARATAVNHQILKPNRSMDDKAVLVARMNEIQVGSQESVVARVRVPGVVVHA